MTREKYIRLFVSSTFNDMRLERDILQSTVFPEIKEFCNSHGWEFEAVDLRWGIGSESGLDQKTMHICLSELKRCQRVSPKPNFLVLMGDRYGWIPLPESLPASLYGKLYHYASVRQAGLLEEWYRKDENELPEAVYVLQPRRGKYEASDIYEKDVAEPLRQLIRDFVLGHPEDSFESLISSATEQEIQTGALSAGDSREHIIIYRRRLSDIPEDLMSVFDDIGNDSFAKARHSHLERELYKATSPELRYDAGIKYCDYIGSTYPDIFARNISDRLKKVIAAEMESWEKISDVESEAERIRTFIQASSACFIGRDEEISAVFRSLLTAESGCSMLVCGKSGTGKSGFLANVAAMLSGMDCDSIPVFSGTSAFSSSGDNILRYLYEKLAAIYPDSIRTDPTHWLLNRKLASLDVERPLFIIVDALDQLDPDDGIAGLHWLPDRLPEAVYVICSVSDDPQYAEVASSPKFQKRLALGALEIDKAGNMVSAVLKRNGRRLTEAQEKAVGLILEKSERTPLFLSLLVRILSRIPSYSELEIDGSCSDIRTLLDRYLSFIVSGLHFDAELIRISLGALSLVRLGIADSEMVRFAAGDGRYWERLVRESVNSIPDIPGQERRIPFIIWSRLYDELSFLFTEMDLDGRLVRFYHNGIRDIVPDLSLFPEEYLDSLKDRLYDFYYSDMSVSGSRHPLYELPCLSSDCRKLFGDFSFISHKLSAHLSSELAADYSLARRKYGPEAGPYFDNLLDFEMRLANTMKEKKLPSDSAYSLTVNSAGSYAPGTVIRKLFEEAYGKGYLADISGWRDVSDDIMRSVPSGPKIDYIDDSLAYGVSLHDGKVRIVEINTGRTVRTVASGVKRYKVSGDMKACLAVKEKAIEWIDIKSGETMFAYSLDDSLIREFYAADTSETAVIQYGRERKTVIYVFRTGKDMVTVRPRAADDADISLAGISGDGNYAFIIAVQDAEDGKDNARMTTVISRLRIDTMEDRSFRFSHSGRSGRQMSLAVSEKGDRIVFNYDDAMVLGNPETGEFVPYMLHFNALGGNSSEYWMSADGNFVLSTGRDSKIVKFDCENKSAVFSFHIPDPSRIFGEAVFFAAGRSLGGILLQSFVKTGDSPVNTASRLLRIGNTGNCCFPVTERGINSLAMDETGSKLIYCYGNDNAFDSDPYGVIVDMDAMRKTIVVPDSDIEAFGRCAVMDREGKTAAYIVHNGAVIYRNGRTEFLKTGFMPYGAALRKDGEALLLSYWKDGSYHIGRYRAGMKEMEHIMSFSAGHLSDCDEMWISENGRYLVLDTGYDSMLLLDTIAGKTLCTARRIFVDEYNMTVNTVDEEGHSRFYGIDDSGGMRISEDNAGYMYLAAKSDGTVCLAAMEGVPTVLIRNNVNGKAYQIRFDSGIEAAGFLKRNGYLYVMTVDGVFLVNYPEARITERFLFPPGEKSYRMKVYGDRAAVYPEYSGSSLYILESNAKIHSEQ